MRVLFVTNQYPTDQKPGASPCIRQQKESLERLGLTVDVLFFDGPASQWHYLKAMLRVFWSVQIRGQYDLVHAHYGLSAIPARAQLRRPVIVTFRGSDVLAPRERLISRLVARMVDISIVMSDEMRQMLGRQDAKVIPYGIDLDLFKPCDQAEARQRLGLDAQHPLVFFPYDPARPGKRFDLITQAVKLLACEFPDVELVTAFREPHESVAAYMNACDAMVLASDTEGAPVAIREALACNLPIVSADVGDVAKLIRGIEGCYIAARSAEDFAEKLAHVLRDRKRTDSRSAALDFDLSKPALEIAEIYKESL